jgi:hypothetical protein
MPLGSLKKSPHWQNDGRGSRPLDGRAMPKPRPSPEAYAAGPEQGPVAGSARGYYDTRIDLEKNDFGEVRTNVAAPFSVYPDPDAPTSDLNQTPST